MLKIATTPRFRRTVTVKVPHGTGYEEQSFDAEFEALTDSVHDSFDTSTAEGIRALLARALLRADDVADDAGELIPWSEDLREALLDRAYVRNALFTTYIGALVGARAGN